ncbi:MAG: ATPase, T2SS/T4P/T4SS family, partial [Reyranella sp.]|nr:ATPase, T2SS/T4P/T4SS family [Reyranella sp.]
MSQLALPKSSHLYLFLTAMVERKASDLFLTVGAPPSVKVQGEVLRLPFQSLHADDIQALAASLLSGAQASRFETEMECDLACVVDGLGRFRFNVYRQRGEVAIVARHIQSKLPSVEALHMPAILEALAMYKRGLVLIVGAAGAGKSTTLASVLDYRNMNQSGHILTIEDP